MVSPTLRVKRAKYALRASLDFSFPTFTSKAKPASRPYDRENPWQRRRIP